MSQAALETAGGLTWSPADWLGYTWTKYTMRATALATTI